VGKYIKDSFLEMANFTDTMLWRAGRHLFYGRIKASGD
jgi:hypothetical protein